MPGLARKVIICAAVDGLVLHPLNSKKDQQQPRSSALPPVRIKYGDASSIATIPRDAAPDLSSLPPNGSFEAFGIVGNYNAPPQTQAQTPYPSPSLHSPELISVVLLLQVS
jgi:hypothetical protein